MQSHSCERLKHLKCSKEKGVSPLYRTLGHSGLAALMSRMLLYRVILNRGVQYYICSETEKGLCSDRVLNLLRSCRAATRSARLGGRVARPGGSYYVEGGREGGKVDSISGFSLSFSHDSERGDPIIQSRFVFILAVNGRRKGGMEPVGVSRCPPPIPPLCVSKGRHA